MRLLRSPGTVDRDERVMYVRQIIPQNLRQIIPQTTAQALAHGIAGIVCAALAGCAQQLIDGVISVIRGGAVEQVRFRCAISGIVRAVTGAIQDASAGLMWHGEQPRQAVVGVAGRHVVGSHPKPVRCTEESSLSRIPRSNQLTTAPARLGTRPARNSKAAPQKRKRVA